MLQKTSAALRLGSTKPVKRPSLNHISPSQPTFIVIKIIRIWWEVQKGYRTNEATQLYASQFTLAIALGHTLMRYSEPLQQPLP